MKNRNGREYRLDEIDRKIIYSLMGDARHTSAPAIAETVSVSAATVRNRISQLEEVGIITGYPARVDFERADGALPTVFLCHVTFDDIEGIVGKLRAVPGVVNVRQLIGGRMNLHVLAIGQDTAELRRIGKDIENAGVEIQDEYLLQGEYDFQYTPFGPSDGEKHKPLTDYLDLAGGAEIVELTAHEDAPITGHTLEEATAEGILNAETLVIAIERDDTVLTPRGDTEIGANDIVTVFSPDERTKPSLDAFQSAPKPGDRNPRRST